MDNCAICIIIKNLKLLEKLDKSKVETVLDFLEKIKKNGLSGNLSIPSIRLSYYINKHFVGNINASSVLTIPKISNGQCINHVFNLNNNHLLSSFTNTVLGQCFKISTHIDFCLSNEKMYMKTTDPNDDNNEITTLNDESLKTLQKCLFNQKQAFSSLKEIIKNNDF